MRTRPFLLFAALFALFAYPSFAEPSEGSLAQNGPLTFEGREGEKVVFDHGGASFADRLVRFQAGDPSAEMAFCRGESCLGAPDYAKQKDGTKFASLGKGGHVVLEFVDNRLIDGQGDDLYVFEIGPTIEAMAVDISLNGNDWISVGRVEGSKSSLDIGPFISKGQEFRFVRLTDDPHNGDHSGRTAGADLDAVGAIWSISPGTRQQNWFF